MAQNTFNGSEGSPITLNAAKQWVANYRNQNPGQVEAHFFGFEIIQKILDESGCMGIRIYYGIDDDGKKQLILVGADADMNNLIPSTPNQVIPGENIVADVSSPCPPWCQIDQSTSL